MVGNTASLQSAIHQTPFLFSASVILRENIPTSTAPERTSVKPLPAPPACISNFILGWVLLYSTAHFWVRGYKANAPEKEMDGSLSLEELLPHESNRTETIVIIRRYVFLFMRPLFYISSISLVDFKIIENLLKQKFDLSYIQIKISIVFL